MPGSGGRIARVLLDSPVPALDRLLDYVVPPALDESAQPGVRVTVPLKSAGRTARGWLVDRVHATDFDGEPNALDTVVSEAPVLAPEVWALARAVADRGAGSASDVLRLAIPKRSVAAEKAWLAHRAEESAEMPTGGGTAETRQTTDLPTVDGYPPGLLEAAIDGGGRIALRARYGRAVLADGSTVGLWAVTLAALAARCRASGRTAILVLPDYRDQEQLERALAEVVPAADLVRADSRQSTPARYRGFLRCLDDAPCVVIGNRSAVYAPARRLGLVAIWDDGDPLHHEPLAPYVGDRDIALLRREQQGGALVFAGHARSTETQRLVELGWLHDVSPQRAVSPRIVISATQPGDDDVRRARIPSAAWQAASAALAEGPVLVQVARPGYAPVLACSSCGHAARCDVCDGPLRLTGPRALPSCAWCGRIATDWHCPDCAATRWRQASAGAGRTAEDLGRAFPRTRVIVSDGERPLTAVTDEPALVVATRGAEPIAPSGYRAVLLLDGDRMLARETLRVGEDCLRWWSNAAVLAAERAPVHLVGVGGRLAAALATWTQPAYAAAELSDRRDLHLPPAVRVASVAGRPKAVQAVLDGLDPALLTDVLGPVPTADDTTRAVLRFDYAHGAAVARETRAAVIRSGAGRRGPAARGRPRPAPTLRIRFDDPEIL